MVILKTLPLSDNFHPRGILVLELTQTWFLLPDDSIRYYCRLLVTRGLEVAIKRSTVDVILVLFDSRLLPSLRLARVLFPIYFKHSLDSFFFSFGQTSTHFSLTGSIVALHLSNSFTAPPQSIHFQIISIGNFRLIWFQILLNPQLLG